MEETHDLIKVVSVDETKCVNCHSCITACPVKYCNDGSDTYVKINANMCIACGNCIKACTHEARNFIDDFDTFLQDLQNNEQIVAIVAPSVAASFPDTYMHLNGWLKSIGVKAVFDVSFGAELTVKSYLEYVKKSNPEIVIAQPCAAIVTYLELYQPELLKHLAPVHSPMLHTIQMVKNFYPEYANHMVAILSPCNAKKREFTETGLGDYNIAYISINKHLEANKIDLKLFEPSNFDNPEAERAVLFSTPGGLLETAERWMPEIRKKTRKIEGIHVIYDYLKKLPGTIENKRNPLLIDCLSCEMGCNGGPLTLAKDKPMDEVEYAVEQRNLSMQKQYLEQNQMNQLKTNEHLESIVNKFWKEEIYNRKYINRWKNLTIKYPNAEELEIIYKSMYKYTEEDRYNCSACGYGLCENMATAIFNKLNKPENCHFYLIKEAEYSHKEIEKGKNRLQNILESTQEGYFQINKSQVIVDANPAMCKILKKNDIVGRSIFDFLDTENAAKAKEQIKLRSENKNSVYELVLTNSESQKVHCLISGTPLFDDNKKPIGSFAIVSDITEIVKAQEFLKEYNKELESRVKERTLELESAFLEIQMQKEEVATQNEELLQQREELLAIQENLEQSNEKLEIQNAKIKIQKEDIERKSKELDLLVEKLQAINVELEKLSIVAEKTDNSIVIMDAQTNLLWANDGFELLYGIPVQELMSQNPNLLELSSHPDIKVLVNKLITTKKSVLYQNSNIRRNGELFWTQTTLTPHLNENGELSKIISIESDITKLKEAENEIILQKQEIEKQQKALTESESKFRLLVENQREVIYSLQPDGIIDYLSPSFENLFQVNPDEFVGKNILHLVAEDDHEKFHLDAFVYLTSEPIEFRSGIESNSNLWLRTIIHPTFNHNKVSKIHGVITDITKEKEAEFALLQSEKTLRQKNDTITDSIHYAKRIQSAMMINEEFLKRILPNTFIYYRPKDIVSGDFYWAFKKKNYIMFAVADCTGHGVPGAFMSMLGIAFLNEIVNKSEQFVASEILDKLKAYIIKSLHQKGKTGELQDGMDISFCIFDVDNYTLQYAGAYNSLVLIANDINNPGKYILNEYKADKMPIGILINKEVSLSKSFKNNNIQINKNDRIYLYTDGYKDQIGGTKGRKLLSTNFKELLLSIQDYTMENQLILLDQAFEKWKGRFHQVDDVLVLGIKL